MLAEMTLSKGRSLSSPFRSLARYVSERVASSPRTAYLASRTLALMLLTFRLRRAVVDDMVRWVANIVVLGQEGLTVCSDIRVSYQDRKRLYE